MTEESVREVCAGLKSARAHERKRSADTLKDFLSRTTVPSLVTNNTLKKSGYTWNCVFDDINYYIMKETEKYEIAKSYRSVTAPLCESLLHLCVACANKGHAYITSEKITDACLIILSDCRLTKAIGDAYLNLLYKHFLPIEHYLGYITPSTWESLFDVTISICLSDYSSLDELHKIRLLWFIVKKGCNYCQFAITLRDCLSKFKKYFFKVHDDKKVQEFIMEVAILLLKSLHVESRITVCEFSESIMPIVFKFYETNMSNKTKVLMFEFLKATYVIHDPLSGNSKRGCYITSYTEKWKRHLDTMLEIVCMEINSIQRMSKQNEIEASDEFYYVAAYVFYKSFEVIDSRIEPENVEETSAKKLKLSFSKIKSFKDLLEELRANCGHWIGIAFMYVKHYAFSISHEEYLVLLTTLECIITSNNKNVNWDSMKKLACLVVTDIANLGQYTQDNCDNLISFWSVCVRNATIDNSAHRTIHSIMQTILHQFPLKYEVVQPLLASYIEKGLPVNDHSIKTLNILYYKCYKKLCHLDIKQRCFAWLTEADIFTLDDEIVSELLLRLICNENFPAKCTIECISGDAGVYNTIFCCTDKSILYSEFEYEFERTKSVTRNELELFEINKEMFDKISTFLEICLSNSTQDVINDRIKNMDYVKYVSLVLAFLDTLLKSHLKTSNDIKSMPLYTVCCDALRHVYTLLTAVMKSDVQIRNKIVLLQAVQKILLNEFHDVLNDVVRQYVDNDCVHCINNIIIQDVIPEDGEFFDEDIEYNAIGLKQNCVYLLSAYCRKGSVYTDELVQRILDTTLYNFSLSAEIECAFRCINILNTGMLAPPTLELIFSLMQDMCKKLFRNSEVTRGLLKILLQILEKIILQGDDLIQNNCFIMINGYLRRSSKMPPEVAALVYECLAKVISFSKNRKDDLLSNYTFKETLMDALVDSNHCIRLYCSYLLTVIGEELSEEDITHLLDRLSNIFMINTQSEKETVLQDESRNRSLTVLHCFYTLGITNTYFLHDLILKAIQFQKNKTMDKRIVKKALNILTQKVLSITISDYMNANIVRILHYWFGQQLNLDNLPLYLFGFEHLDDFLVTHMKWLVVVDFLWKSTASEAFSDSDVVKRLKQATNKSDVEIIEDCFCNIISQCLPYIVLDKYKLENENPIMTDNCKKIYQFTRDILNGERWSQLFVDNLGDLIYLTATHMEDVKEASKAFNLTLKYKPTPHKYSQRIFSNILRYFGELMDENIMLYLCKDQPILILSILFQLWDNVLAEKIFDCKVCALHSFLTFVDNVSLGHSSDAMFCNFLFSSFTYAIKNSKGKGEVHIYVQGLKMVLSKITKHSSKCIDMIQKSNKSTIFSVLNTKIEEGYKEQCDSLLQVLSKNIKQDANEGVDVIDCFQIVANDDVKISLTKSDFVKQLKAYALNLSYASYKTVSKLCQYLKQNHSFINDLYADIGTKGFSEECKASLIHQIVFKLSSLLKSSAEKKIVIEACNCLSEICTYELKTLVTVPPADVKKIIDLDPNKYFADLVIKSLFEHIFDEDPTVSKKITTAINALLKYRDGQAALETTDADRTILQSLSSLDCKMVAEYKIDNAVFDEYNDIDYWVPLKDESHLQWITRITSAMLNLLSSTKNYLNCLRSVCIAKPVLCQSVLPGLIGLILSYSSDIHLNVFEEQIKQVFKYLCENSRNDNDSSDIEHSSNESCTLKMNEKMVVEYMLDIVNFVRIQATHYIKKPRQRYNSWYYLKLDHEAVARAAAAAGRHWRALYYGELHADTHGPGQLRDVFRKSYIAIGELDAVDGCGIEHLTSEEEKRKHLMSTGQYSDALLLHDLALSRSHATSCRSPSRSLTSALGGAVVCLHRAGMHHLALRYIKSYPQTEDLDDIKYDCLSYLGDWSEIVDTSQLEVRSGASANQTSVIKALRYACLKDCFNIQPSIESSFKFEKLVNDGKFATAQLCHQLNLENCQSVYKIVSYLHLFRDIENYFSVRCGKKTVSNLIDEWKIDNLPPFTDFKHLEPVISQRSLILENISQSNLMQLSAVNDLQLQYASITAEIKEFNAILELGLKNNRIEMAQRLVAAVKNVQSTQKVVLLESQISWAKGHKDISLSLLRSVISQTCQDPKLMAISLRQYGLWMSECKRENSNDIHSYLKRSLDALNGSEEGCTDTRRKVYHDIAKIADDEYKQVVAYMQSPVFENKVKCVESMKETAESLKTSQQTVSRVEDKSCLRVKYIVNRTFGELDEAEIANTRAEKESYLKLAMRYYLLSLKHSDHNDLSLFRIISLWLDNIGFDFDDDEFDFAQTLDEIPSWKFITALPQLAPRLSTDSTVFSNLLRNIILRCAKEHPHHTLPILFSLKNSEKGEEGSGVPEPRVVAAADLLARLAAAPSATPHAAPHAAPHTTLILRQMELVCDAIISFAYWMPKSKDVRPQVVPKAEAISKLCDLDAVPIPTDDVPIRKDCDYSNISTLKAFEKYFELVGGVNCPKKISCLGSDGKNRILLIKGKDDMRQDAVMQQVFNIVNTLLVKNPITKRNKLLIRTYKVAPMSRRAGAARWCAGTEPLGRHLALAHASYRPQDISPKTARKKLALCHENRKSNKHKLEVFTDILKEFKPVFQYFFTEHYLDPVMWYERRLAYTRSVATSSMVGYILGIGDRHVQNILIDKITAEVIHIDFGIAFDQGKTLPTPETVPFRLTQDIVAGFGSSGVEGSFRRCCEKTLQLLRDNQDTLLTILEVLLCDPLYLWTASTTNTPKTSRDAQGGGGLAARALLAVGGRLGGAEGGAGGVSVAGHVASLLRAAADPANLCRLFPGWQPYM